jgi:hypothetical protein
VEKEFQYGLNYISGAKSMSYEERREEFLTQNPPSYRGVFISAKPVRLAIPATEPIRPGFV